eukprot:8131778-Prorocentrum_lima.AAC.1
MPPSTRRLPTDFRRTLRQALWTLAASCSLASVLVGPTRQEHRKGSIVPGESHGGARRGVV